MTTREENLLTTQKPKAVFMALPVPTTGETPPNAFLCTSTQAVMTTPVLSLCGHLFEKTILNDGIQCPRDGCFCDSLTCIPFEELKQQIQRWKNSCQAVEDNPLDKITNRFSSFQISSAQKNLLPQIVIQNAHTDDIHGFARIGPDRFVSGSKDSNVKEWDSAGQLVKEYASGIRGYQYWVTALTTLRNGYWACGTRDGLIVIWDNDGKKIRTIKLPPDNAKKQAVCKERNRDRINCIEEYNYPEHTFYTGTPKFLHLWDIKSGTMIRQHFASDNDWVYCVKKLGEQNLLVAIGSKLEHWDMKNPENPRKSTIIREEKTTGPSRPHIASIVQLANQPHLWAAACFDAKVRVADVESQQIVHRLEEHKGRVWSVANVNTNNFASSADDRTVKIWDMRKQDAVLTLSEHPGRVSSLLSLSDNVLVSGSCPDNLRTSTEKACITFWDLRKILV